MQRTRRQMLAASAGLAVAPLIGAPALAQKRGRSSTLVVAGFNMRHLNPAIQSGQATGLPGAQIFAGLLQFDREFKPQPSLAKSWEVSSDGLNYRFHLVENGVFHDGRPITARDVAFSMETVKASHPLLSVPLKQVMDKAVAVGTHTVDVRLSKAYGGYLHTLVSALTPILPEHVYGVGSIQSNPANARPVGSGPYRFVEWKPDEYLMLERHEKYFRPNRPYLDRVIMRLVEDPLTRVLAMEKGSVDYMPFSYVHFADVRRLEKNPKLKISTKGYEALGLVVYLNINLREAPLNDLRVRQAIAHAMDKDFIVNTLNHGLPRRLDGPLLPENPFFDAQSVTVYKHDLALANQLLDAAGHRRKASGTRFQLTLDIPVFQPDSTQVVAEYLKSQLSRVGIDIVLRPSTDLADWSNRVGKWNYQLSMDGSYGYPDPSIGVTRLFVCDNIKKQIWTNTQGYCNPQVDDWLTTAMTEPDPAKRKQLYAKFQKAVTTELPFIWTTDVPITTIYKAELQGIPDGVWGALSPLDDVRWATTPAG